MVPDSIGAGAFDADAVVGGVSLADLVRKLPHVGAAAAGVVEGPAGVAGPVADHEEARSRHSSHDFLLFLTELHERNRDPCGIWSDGEVVYVVDEQDKKLYIYNLPDAIDTRLALVSPGPGGVASKDSRIVPISETRLSVGGDVDVPVPVPTSDGEFVPLLGKAELQLVAGRLRRVRIHWQLFVRSSEIDLEIVNQHQHV